MNGRSSETLRNLKKYQQKRSMDYNFPFNTASMNLILHSANEERPSRFIDFAVSTIYILGYTNLHLMFNIILYSCTLNVFKHHIGIPISQLLGTSLFRWSHTYLQHICRSLTWV